MSIQRSGTTSSLLHTYAASSSSQITIASDTGPLVVDLGHPHQFACTREGATVVFYKDGVKSGATKTLGTNSAVDWGSRAPVSLCNRGFDTTGEATSANVVFAGIWNRALTPDDLFRLWLSPWLLLERF
jgi:hypothetical protein